MQPRKGKYILPAPSPMSKRTRNKGVGHGKGLIDKHADSSGDDSSVHSSFCGDDVTFVKTCNYKLDVKKSLAKKYEASMRDLHVSAWITGGGLRITFTPVTYELFRQCFSDIYTQDKISVLTQTSHVRDRTGIVQQTTVRLTYQDDQDKVTVNFYHTTSSVLINGPAQRRFTEDDLIQICALATTVCPVELLDFFNDNLVMVLEEALSDRAINQSRTDVPTTEQQTTESTDNLQGTPPLQSTSNSVHIPPALQPPLVPNLSPLLGLLSRRLCRPPLQLPILRAQIIYRAHPLSKV